MSDVIEQPPAPASLFGEDSTPTDKPKRERKISAAKEAMLAEHLPPNLGKPLKVTTPDFSDPNRPKTCLEVDFPLVPINALSSLEGNAGKPIYQMSKWWARRRSCVFRALLLAAAMEAPTQKDANGNALIGPDGKPLIDEDAAAQLVWDAYYANHQLAGNFKNLKVLDPFMGGGTTLVEGSRLGFQVAGVDLNPVAWFIVKNELACTDPKEVKAFFDKIEADVKPQVQPFYVTEGVGGRKGTWFKVGADGSREKLPADFDPIALPPTDRKPYQYEGPEVIYTFWAKHGPCSKPGCGHRTPIFRSPVVATKKLGVKYLECTCKQCKLVFHAELGDARIAPDAEQVVLDNEHPYTLATPAFARRMIEYTEGSRADKDKRIGELNAMVETEPGLNCPRCGSWSGQFVRDILKKHQGATRAADIDKKHLGILPKGVAKKPVYCTLLIDPDWLKGSPGEMDGVDGVVELGGYIDAPVEATDKWYRERLKNLRLIEVRGQASATPVSGAQTQNSDPNARAFNSKAQASDPKAQAFDPKTTASDAETPDSDADEAPGLPPTIVLSDGRIINTRFATMPGNGEFICQACGQKNTVLRAAELFGKVIPEFPYAIQAFDPDRNVTGSPYGGRYFATPSRNDLSRLLRSCEEWALESTKSLAGFWPTSEVPFGNRTHVRDPINRHGYTHWYRMFNPRQILGLTTLHRAIHVLGKSVAPEVRDQALGAFLQYVRNQNIFCIWDIGYDKLVPHFSNNNYNPKLRTIENNWFASLGRGNWLTCVDKVIEAQTWSIKPTETHIGEDGGAVLISTDDPIISGMQVLQGSATQLDSCTDDSLDLVITDPPFGDLIDYAELADFFYVWLRLGFAARDDVFRAEYTPKSMEIVTNPVRNRDDPDGFYSKLLTSAWGESFRVLKPSGILAFTFHHSEDEPWLAVLESLLEAGFYLEATYPIRSDETKGAGAEFGSKKIEYDIIHVCRKRLEEPRAVSWPKMRQWVKGELARLRPLLESFKNRGLSDADVRVILRGKALEFYSRHYGKVMVNVPGGEEAVLSIRDALLGINQLLDESSGQPGERPPSIVQPVVYQYLRLFGTKPTYTRDEVSKLLRGTTIQQSAFEKTGSTPWIAENEKVVTRIPIYDRFQKMVKRSRRELKTELDQTHFLIGAAMPAQEGDTSVNIEKELERETFLIRPGVEALLDWYSKTPAGADEPGIPKAAATSLQLLRAAFEARRARMKQEDPSLFDEWEASLATVA
jgi:hypothetical protein